MSVRYHRGQRTVSELPPSVFHNYRYAPIYMIAASERVGTPFAVRWQLCR